MKRFAALYQALDASTSTEAKVRALQRYLGEAAAEDAAWAVYLLAGGRPRRVVPTALLRQAALAASGLPEWLFEASYQAAGDLAETIALVLPAPDAHDTLGLGAWMTERLLPLRGADPEHQVQQLCAWWRALSADERFLLVKLIGGGFRVGVSRALVERALARHAGLDGALVAQRMMGYTDARHRPDAAALHRLTAPDRPADAPAGASAGASVGMSMDGRPYPFYLAHALPADWQVHAGSGPALGAPEDWIAEWKYDGVRAQLVRRGGQVWLWSRGEELLAGRFPEVEAQAMALPNGTVLDGELLVWRPGAEVPEPFARLQQRLQRKTVGRKLLAEAPVVFLAYDLLEIDGADCRAWPLQARRERLQAVQALRATTGLACAAALDHATWQELAEWRQRARARGMEGLMLKHRAAPYGVGRTKAAGIPEGGWWKWKLAPMEVDAVLIYAQAGHGRRAGLYTDFTFAVWNRPPQDPAEAQRVVEAIVRRAPPQPEGLQLVAFAKAYSGLTDAELVEVDAVVRGHTLEKFGPVRSVRPTLVMTLGFEGIQASRRHKSGLALRFPRILRWRRDKPLHEADSLPQLQALLPASGPTRDA